MSSITRHGKDYLVKQQRNFADMAQLQSAEQFAASLKSTEKTMAIAERLRHNTDFPATKPSEQITAVISAGPVGAQKRLEELKAAQKQLMDLQDEAKQREEIRKLDAKMADLKNPNIQRSFYSEILDAIEALDTARADQILEAWSDYLKTNGIKRKDHWEIKEYRLQGGKTINIRLNLFAFVIDKINSREDYNKLRPIINSLRRANFHVDSMSITPLDWAVNCNDFGLSQKLVFFGADVDKHTCCGKSPRQIAEGQTADYFEWLDSTRVHPTEDSLPPWVLMADFDIALKDLNIEGVKNILEGGFYPDTYFDYNFGSYHGGATPLFYCLTMLTIHRDSQNEKIPEMIKLLIHFGANIDKKNSNGQTKLELAATNGHLELVQILLKHGANPYHEKKSSSCFSCCSSRQLVRSDSKEVSDYLKEFVAGSSKEDDKKTSKEDLKKPLLEQV